MQFEQLQRELNERYSELSRVLHSNLRSNSVARSNGPADSADVVTEWLDRERSLSLAELQRKELLQIEEALEALNSGKGGSCAECGNRIPAARLKAIPSATLCISCQEQRDCDQAQHRFPMNWN